MCNKFKKRVIIAKYTRKYGHSGIYATTMTKTTVPKNKKDIIFVGYESYRCLYFHLRFMLIYELLFSKRLDKILIFSPSLLLELNEKHFKKIECVVFFYLCCFFWK